jgi:hypothetical protein
MRTRVQFSHDGPIERPEDWSPLGNRLDLDAITDMYCFCVLIHSDVYQAVVIVFYAPVPVLASHDSADRPEFGDAEYVQPALTCPPPPPLPHARHDVSHAICLLQFSCSVDV